MALRALFVIVSTGLGIGIGLTAEFQGIVHPLVGAGIGAAMKGDPPLLKGFHYRLFLKKVERRKGVKKFHPPG